MVWIQYAPTFECRERESEHATFGTWIGTAGQLAPKTSPLPAAHQNHYKYSFPVQVYTRIEPTEFRPFNLGVFVDSLSPQSTSTRQAAIRLAGHSEEKFKGSA
jgi:hypothetical protein